MPRAALYKGAQGCLALGYLSEHFRIALQVAVAIGLGMLFVVVNKSYDFLGDASVWIVVSVVVAFSNNLGATFQSALLAIVGSIVGAALGILIIALLSGLAMGFSYDNHPKTMSVWACVLMALVGFLLALNKERFPRMQSAFSFALLTYPIVAIPGFRAADENYMERLKLSLCALIGVLLTVLVAVVVFPIRARTMLRKRTAMLLERMGNLAFYLMGEFCEDPDDDMRLKGSSGTDEHQHYVDDGLQRKYEGLHQMRLALNRDLVDMAALIGPAHAELSYLKLFRRRTSHYSMCIYRDVNRLCGRCLTTLGNLHMYMEGGHMRMGLCVIHKQLIQELRQDIAAAFTCLSGLIINKESDEDARETMENLCSAALEFQATMYSLPIRAEYNIHVETLALFSKISTSVARQAASMYMELRPEGGARIHKVLCTHMDRTSSKPLSVEEHSPAPSRASSGEPPSSSPYGRPSRENAQALIKVLGDNDPASPQGWDVEKGAPGALTQSPDPLLRLGRLPSISESDSRRKSPFSVPSVPPPAYMRAMSFPGHLLIPDSVFGSTALLQPAQSAQSSAPKPPPQGNPVGCPADFPPVSSSESSSDHSSGLSPRANLPQRPSSKQFRDMLRKHMTGQSREPRHAGSPQPDNRQPLGLGHLSPATSAEEPERLADSAPGPGRAGQDEQPRHAPGVAPPQTPEPGLRRHVSFRRPPAHRRSGSLPASRSGSVHMQGDMQCGSLSDDDEEEADDFDTNHDNSKAEGCTDNDKEKPHSYRNDDKSTAADDKSASRTAFNPDESCELCHTPSGIKDGKPSPWMWSRSTSFRSPDNPF